MPLLISDANILIDMEVGDLIQEMFDLPEAFAVPDTLYEEELKKRHPYLPDVGLVILEMSSEIVGKVFELKLIHQGPSANDLLALLLAMEKGCPLITGDKQLRSVAKKEKAEVYGTLWLVQRLLDEHLIDHQRAKDAYKAMKEDKRRLPWGKVDEQLKNYE